MSTVLFLSGQSMGDALGGIGRSYAPLFEELGHEFVEINLQNDDAIDRLNRIVRERVIEFAFSYVGMCADLGGTTTDGKSVNFWESLRIPYISLFGDSPAYFFDRHVMPSRLAACIYAFPEHCAFRSGLPQINGLLGVYPPIPMDSQPKAKIDFKAKERGRLLFLKNGNDPEALISEWRTALPASTFMMMADIASLLVSGMASGASDQIVEAVDEYFRDRGLHIATAPKLRLFFVAQLDDYLRRIKSTMLANTLAQFPVDMYGYNWDHINFSGKRIRYTLGGDYTQSAPLIRDALGLVDMSPNTTLSAHERPLRAFGAYTLCLTNAQVFFDANVANSAAFSFSFKPDAIAAKIADVIANPKRYVEVGIEAAESFRAKFPRLRFAEFLVETAAAVRLSCSERPAALQPFFVWPPRTI